MPVINGLTDRTHPCQLMADVMTFEEHRGPIAGSTVAWSGAGNNVAASWIHAAVRFDFELRVACPPELAPAAAVARVGEARRRARAVERAIPARRVAAPTCVVTDTWVPMRVG